MNKSFWFLQTLFVTVAFTITSLWLAFVAYGRWQRRESAEAEVYVGGPEGSKEAADGRRTEAIPRVGPTLRRQATLRKEIRWQSE